MNHTITEIPLDQERRCAYCEWMMVPPRDVKKFVFYGLTFYLHPLCADKFIERYNRVQARRDSNARGRYKPRVSRGS